MSLQSAQTEHAGLGEYLRGLRINRGIDLVTVAGETKISTKNLQAIEENDFATLPAEAFTRGLYVLYARMLSIDPEEILQMYAEERPKRHKSADLSILPTHKIAEKVGNMAERPTFMPFSFIGLILLLSLLFGGFLCWYFSWNPAIYLSQKLRSLDQNHEPVEISRFYQDSPGPVATVAQFAEWQEPRHKSLWNNFFGPSSSPYVTTAVMQVEITDSFSPVAAQTNDFFANTEFNTATELRLNDRPSSGTQPVF